MMALFIIGLVTYVAGPTHAHGLMPIGFHIFSLRHHYLLLIFGPYRSYYPLDYYSPTIAVTSFLVYLLRISPLYIRVLNLASISLMPFPPPSPPLALQCTSRSPRRCPPPWCVVVPKPPTITTASVVVGITTNAPKTLTLHPASNDAHVSLVLLLPSLAAAETLKTPPKRLR